jgi:hypothetical protein
VSRRSVRSALATLAVGLGLAFAAAEMAPLPGPPLYDGVVPVEAYRWLVPPPGEHGGAEGASQVLPVSGDTSPLVAVATPELTPQAQLFAAPGALTLPPGTTSITVSITPVEAANLPTEGHLDGNVYRITVVNQAGAAATAPASASVSIILRAPNATTTEATVNLLKGDTWQPLQTDAAGLGATFLAVVTEFGDFALTQAGPAGTPAGSGGPAGTASPSNPAASGAATPAPSGAGGGGSDQGIPQVTILAGIAIAVVLAGLLASAFLPRRKPRGAARRPPPRTRR